MANLSLDEPELESAIFYNGSSSICDDNTEDDDAVFVGSS